MDPKVAHELSLRIPHLALRVREHRCAAALTLTPSFHVCSRSHFQAAPPLVCQLI